MSIAAYLVADEWDDQSIVDVCIAWRQLHGLTIPRYASKYLATLRNARKTNRFKTSERQLKGAYKQGERKFQIWNLLVEAGPLAPAEIAAKLDMNPPVTVRKTLTRMLAPTRSTYGLALAERQSGLYSASLTMGGILSEEQEIPEQAEEEVEAFAIIEHPVPDIS